MSDSNSDLESPMSSSPGSHEHISIDVEQTDDIARLNADLNGRYAHQTANRQPKLEPDYPLDFSLKKKPSFIAPAGEKCSTSEPNLFDSSKSFMEEKHHIQPQLSNGFSDSKFRSGRSAFEAVSPHNSSPVATINGATENGGRDQFLRANSFPMPSAVPGLYGSVLNPALLAALGQLPLPTVGPVPFDFSSNAPLLSHNINGHAQRSAVGHSNRSQSLQQPPPAKINRPFKMYNPLDPLSALQFPNTQSASALEPMGNPKTVATNPPSPEGTAVRLNGNSNGNNNFLPLYRQYLSNAQQALLRSNNNRLSLLGEEESGGQLSGQGSSSSSCGSSHPGSTTPSPPQVTSTSHPHTEDRGTPPYANGVALDPHGTSHSALNSDTSLPKAAAKPDVEAAIQRSLISDPIRPTTSCSGSLFNRDSSARRRGRSMPDEAKDEAYWERRRKNNEAAKRSRDSRRQKEDEIAMRAAILEQENLRLRLEVAQLKVETEKLRQMLLNT